MTGVFRRRINTRKFYADKPGEKCPKSCVSCTARDRMYVPSAAQTTNKSHSTLTGKKLLKRIQRFEQEKKTQALLTDCCCGCRCYNNFFTVEIFYFNSWFPYSNFFLHNNRVSLFLSCLPHSKQNKGAARQDDSSACALEFSHLSARLKIQFLAISATIYWTIFVRRIEDLRAEGCACV